MVLFVLGLLASPLILAAVILYLPFRLTGLLIEKLRRKET